MKDLVHVLAPGETCRNTDGHENRAQPLSRGNSMKKRPAATAAITAVLALGTTTASFASPTPPTIGGNGAGQSGQ
jgi:hypothetical protein